MSYLALYRKFRPERFEDVKGQDAIVQTLKNQILSDRIGHAYLFCGTRGTGKTTVAKIFAKAVNCAHPVNGSPCGTCEMCRAISEGNSLNVIEIDAASNNGVDNIREIREEVAYRPTEGRYKVYIIDEVHMLSMGAFNALLKTLEEPPEYVIFILATTEVQKIPVTILSRCQRYDFKRISTDTIVERLQELVQQEHWQVEEQALRYIARMADGSMRDALSLLDECTTFYLGGTLTYDQVLEVLGTVDTEVFSRLLEELLEMDVGQVMETVDELVMRGGDISQIAADFTWYLRNLLLVKSSAGTADLLEVSSEDLARFKEEARKIDEDTLLHYIRVLSDLTGQLKTATQKRVLLEVTLIKLCRPVMDDQQDALWDRVRALEQQLAETSVAPSSVTPSAPPEPAPKEESPQEESAREEAQKEKAPEKAPEEAVPQSLQKVVQDFRSVLRETSPLLQSSLKKAKLFAEGTDTLRLVLPDELSAEIVGTQEHLTELSSLLQKKTGTVVKLLVDYARDTDQEPEKIDLESVINMEITVEEEP